MGIHNIFLGTIFYIYIVKIGYIEIIKNNSIEPDTELAQFIKNELRNRHILISTDGPFDSVIKTKPPMCFTKENAQQVVAEIEEVLINYKKSKTFYKK